MNIATNADTTRIRAYFPNRFKGRGPSVTCTNLVESMQAAGAECTVHLNLLMIPPLRVPHHVAMPAGFSRVPYRFIGNVASRRSEAGFLRILRDGDIAYLWPGTSLSTFRKVHARGNPIVMEGINTRMRYAKEILDREYERLGMQPGHAISERNIEVQEEKLGMAAGFFAPSPLVEKSLEGSLLDPGTIIPTSYGVHLGEITPKAMASGDGKKLRVIFVGTVCVRKAAHTLLEAWSRAKIDGELFLVGSVDQEIRTLCADHLNRTDVHVPGFVADPGAFYREADIFVMPSLEEGGPLVTYEAAAHGLPMIVSPMGAGRIGADDACAVPIDPYDVDSLVDALRRLASSAEMRRHFGELARAAARKYDWKDIGARRLAKLRNVLKH